MALLHHSSDDSECQRCRDDRDENYRLCYRIAALEARAASDAALIERLKKALNAPTPGTENQIDYDAIEKLAKSATPGKRSWSGHRSGPMYLTVPQGGQTVVMGFRRLGMRDAQPVFNTDNRLVPAQDLAVQEVEYRDDIIAIDHPDAEFIAACDPATVLALVKKARQRDRAEKEIEAKASALRAENYACPQPTCLDCGQRAAAMFRYAEALDALRREP